MKVYEAKNKYYFVKNFFTLNSYIDLGSLPITYTTNDDSIDEFLIDSFSKDASGKIKFIITEIKDERFDYYEININTHYEVVINYTTKASLIYAIKLVNDLVDVDDVVSLPIIHIDDYASFKTRGIIEGFYGTPWTFDNHFDMVNYMLNHRLNTYLYAPKMDKYHRDNWFMMYPLEYINHFKEINDLFNKYSMTYYYCISPGHAVAPLDGFVYAHEEDFQRLFRKLDQLLSVGITHFGLLLDDIDYNLKGENLERFKRPGIAHSYICNRVYDYLKSVNSDIDLVMCPTEYHEIGDSVYRTDLRNELNKDIKIFYTGDNVCAELISKKCMDVTKKAFGHDLLIWENFPVTDFTYGVRTYIAPIDNRCVELPDFASGYLINPMKDYEMSKVGMSTCSDYAWNTSKYNSDISFINALNDVDKQLVEVGLPYLKFNSPTIVSYGNSLNELKLVEKENFTEVLAIYREATLSAKRMLLINHPFVLELKPWINHLIKEERLAKKIIKLTPDIKKDVVKFLKKDIYFSGSLLFDGLIKHFNILDEEEYKELITKRRGNPWYRVFEYKRYGSDLC